MQDPALYQYPDYPEMKPDFTVPQYYERYTDEDHATWKFLYERQMALVPDYACKEFLEGLAALEVSCDRIPRFEDLNALIYKKTGWELVAVPGLVPDDVFFNHLANKVFPVTHWIRPQEKIDYLQEPDLFHDLFGHVPLLMNPVFADYLAAFGRGGARAMRLGDIRYLDYLARLYWYTVEFGLIQTEAGIRIYGAGILSSKGEVIFSIDDPRPNRLGYDLERLMRTLYKIDDFQQSYFVIESFQQLFESTQQDFKPIYDRQNDQPEIAANVILPTDTVYYVGTGGGSAFAS